MSQARPLSNTPRDAGSDDVARAADELASRLPIALRGLARLAYNYRWSWLPGGADAFRAIDPARWERCGENPVRLLQEVSTRALARAAAEPHLVAGVTALERELARDLARPVVSGRISSDRPVAFFCAEYAVHRSMPIYSGGLGALAGDMLKEASDQALPFVGVGLLYREGYFRQRIDASGWQHEQWDDVDPDRLPAARVRDDSGAPLTVVVRMGDANVAAHVWRVDVGRVPLFLLDADHPANDRWTRWITSRLYPADTGVRLAQYMLLGVGGVRALEGLGITPGIVHLNEGHAALAALEAARIEMELAGDFESAIAHARARTVFTTHTPVPAGNDTYPIDQVTPMLAELAAELEVDVERLVRLGESGPDGRSDRFGMTELALRCSAASNAVSRRHGDVARGMWAPLWPGRDVREVPIRHVTNGVHVPTWMGDPMRELLERRLGARFVRDAADPERWSAVDAVSDRELWQVRCEQRAALVAEVRDRSIADRLRRSDDRDYAMRAAHAFDPDVLTIGFARRVATYKRLHLLLQDPSRAFGLLSSERPIQIVLAGKAHPQDEDAKRLIQHLFSAKDVGAVGARVVFLDDYDVDLAARMVQGCDAWANLPRPPLEASGTSGMKSALNGGLNLSVLDGWWSEAYDGTNGWALPGDENPDHAAQDAHHGAELYRLLEEELVPAFYDRDDDGVPLAWVSRIRVSLRTLPPMFCATRMLTEYQRDLYETALAVERDAAWR